MYERMDDLIGDIPQFEAAVNEHRKDLPKRLFWRECTAQHFDTLTGIDAFLPVDALHQSSRVLCQNCLLPNTKHKVPNPFLLDDIRTCQLLLLLRQISLEAALNLVSLCITNSFTLTQVIGKFLS